MLPAPKASALPGNSTNRAMAMSRTWFVESPMFAMRSVFGTERRVEGREIKKQKRYPSKDWCHSIAPVSAAEANVARGRNDVKAVGPHPTTPSMQP